MHTLHYMGQVVSLLNQPHFPTADIGIHAMDQDSDVRSQHQFLAINVLDQMAVIIVFSTQTKMFSIGPKNTSVLDE